MPEVCPGFHCRNTRNPLGNGIPLHATLQKPHRRTQFEVVRDDSPLRRLIRDHKIAMPSSLGLRASRPDRLQREFATIPAPAQAGARSSRACAATLLKKNTENLAQNRGAGSTPTSPSAIRLSRSAEILNILPDARINDRAFGLFSGGIGVCWSRGEPASCNTSLAAAMSELDRVRAPEQRLPNVVAELDAAEQELAALVSAAILTDLSSWPCSGP
jgi:hypothetical protein